MIFLHEIHEVVGTREGEFEAAFREGWMPLLAKGEDARLLYFLHHAHGTGVSYNAVTITVVRDGAAWERLAKRVESGDLSDWARGVDRLRHDVTAKILVPLPWSPLQRVELDEVPSSGDEHDLTVFLEDTVVPYEGQLDLYIERSGSHYAREMGEAASRRMLSVEGGFRTAFGSHRRREVVLWQKVVNPQWLVPLITREMPPELNQPGSWMHDALELRDRWESKLLRTARWSPWY
jgi:hypothetical protein